MFIVSVCKFPISIRSTKIYRLLIPLNVCRKNNLYLPWECEHERYVYMAKMGDYYLRLIGMHTKSRHFYCLFDVAMLTANTSDANMTSK